MWKERMTSPLRLGFLAGAMLIVAADAGHWFISSASGADALQTWLVAGQLAVGAGVSIWAYRRGKTLEVDRRHDTDGAARPAG